MKDILYSVFRFYLNPEKVQVFILKRLKRVSLGRKRKETLDSNLDFEIFLSQQFYIGDHRYVKLWVLLDLIAMCLKYRRCWWQELSSFYLDCHLKTHLKVLRMDFKVTIHYKMCFSMPHSLNISLTKYMQRKLDFFVYCLFNSDKLLHCFFS